MTDLIRVVIVDDHLVSRKGIAGLLACNPNIELVAEGSAGNHVLELLAEHQPDVLLTDLQMPAHQNMPKGALFEPISCLQQVIKEHDSLSVVVLSQEQDVHTIQSLAEIGVKGYLLKTDNFTELLGKVVEMIHVGTAYFSPEIRDIILAAPRIRRNRKLTNQQLAVLQTIADFPGMSRAQIAELLNISPSTLYKHINQINVVMEARNTIEALLTAIRQGLINFEKDREQHEGTRS
jgi:DNA-binding NarL/FixJ family response regulator